VSETDRQTQDRPRRGGVGGGEQARERDRGTEGGTSANCPLRKPAEAA
jgi:hypothetical protein